jgi:choline-sulfatase
MVRLDVPLLAMCVVACAGGGEDVSGSSKAPSTEKTNSPALSGTPSAASVPSGSPSGAASAQSPSASTDLNVLVMSIDSLRWDRMKRAGYAKDVIPNVTALEKTAISYSRFYATSSYTSMSLGGFLGGRYASEMKRSGYFFGVYPEDELLFPEVLQKAGVRTMSAHAHFYFGKEKAGFHQGFDVYELIPNLKKNNTTDENVTSPDHTAIVLRHLGDPANTKGRFFAWYHFLDPHDQYVKHDEVPDLGGDKKGAEKAYDGELWFTDKHVGQIIKFVDSQPWGKKTAIVITADHGEAFGEKKMYRHGFELWNVLTHVPLIIRLPGAAPRTIDEPRGMIDLAPTFLELYGIPAEPTFHGTSLVSELRGGDAAARDVVVDLARTSDNDRRRALIRGNYKIIEFGDADAYQLYDVVKDPLETTDLAKKEKARFEEMKTALVEANKSIKDVCPKMTEKLKGKKKTKPC